MRSSFVKVAAAAIAMSTSIAAAYATPTLNGEPLSPLQTETLRARGVPPQEIDAMPTGAITKSPMAMPAEQTMIHKAAYRPRLEHIVSEIGATNHRIRTDHNRGYLTAAEFRKFSGRAANIRMDAMQIARNHRGALPEGRFANLQMRVQRLNQDIHRAVTS